MTDEKKPTVYQQQNTTKPKIEHIIPDHLDGDMKKSALDFVAYLRANKMSPAWSVANTWIASYKGKSICRIELCYPSNPLSNEDQVLPFIARLHRHSWYVTPYTYYYDTDEYRNLIMGEGLHKTIWDDIKYCDGCPPKTGKPRTKNRPCIGGKDVTVFDKEFKGVCANFSFTHMWNFFDPDEVTIDFIKKLLEFEQKARGKVK